MMLVGSRDSAKTWAAGEELQEERADGCKGATHVVTGTFVGAFSYGGMPYDEAERNLRLFAREVMRALRAVDEPAGTRRALS